MVKVIVCLSDPEAREKVAASLEGAGVNVFLRCATGAEVLRAMQFAGEGVVVCAPRMRDRTADELAYDLEGRALMLVAGRPQVLSDCEHPDIFRLPAPFSARELASSVNMLVQLAQMRRPRRSEAERELIFAAKAVVMRENGLTEDQAHHFLQRASMESGRRMSDVAERILKEREGNA